MRYAEVVKFPLARRHLGWSSGPGRLTRLRLAVATVAVVLGGCTAPDCTLYGRGYAGSGCAVVGPAPTGGGH